MKNIIFVALILAAWFFVFLDIKHKRIKVKASFWWSLLFFIMLFLSIFPQSIDSIAGWFGVSYAPALLFTFCILFLLFMNYRSNKRIDALEEKVTKLEQEIVIDRVKNNDKKK